MRTVFVIEFIKRLNQGQDESIYLLSNVNDCG